MIKLASMALNWGLSLVSGLTLKQWAYVLGALAGAFVAWQVYSWAYGRGAADSHAKDKIKIEALKDDVERLVTGIGDAKEAAEIAQANGEAKAAAAAAQAQKVIADVERARRREQTRGAGATNMNEFFAETFP